MSLKSAVYVNLVNVTIIVTFESFNSSLDNKVNELSYWLKQKLEVIFASFLIAKRSRFVWFISRYRYLLTNYIIYGYCRFKFNLPVHTI
jgi:phage-related protein